MNFLKNMFNKKIEDKLLIATKNAAENPANQYEFYKILLASDLYIPIYEPSNSLVNIEKGGKISVIEMEKKDGTRFIPVFSSANELSRASKKETQYVAINSKEFFEMTRGAHYILNLASDFGKEITPSEADELISGKLLNNSNQIIVEKDMQVLLAQPSNPPHDLMINLSQIFKKYKHILKAYLALIQTGKDKGLPHFMIALQMEPIDTKVFDEAGLMLKSLLKNNEIVDFYILKNNDEFSDYFYSIEPFYTNK